MLSFASPLLADSSPAPYRDLLTESRRLLNQLLGRVKREAATREVQLGAKAHVSSDVVKAFARQPDGSQPKLYAHREAFVTWARWMIHQRRCARCSQVT